MSKSAAPRFLRRPKARPDELIAAALTVFGERGFRQTTLEEVAARAGVSKGTVYLYFSSKDDLFRAVVKHKVVTLIEPAEEMARTHEGSSAELLTLLVQRMWAAMSQSEMVCLSRLVQAELAQFPDLKEFYFTEVIQRHRRLIRAIAARGVARGEFRRVAIQLLPRILPAIVMQLNQTRWMFGDLDRGAPKPEWLRDNALDVVLHGVTAPAQARTPARRHRRASATKGKQ